MTINAFSYQVLKLKRQKLLANAEKTSIYFFSIYRLTKKTNYIKNIFMSTFNTCLTHIFTIIAVTRTCLIGEEKLLTKLCSSAKTYYFNFYKFSFLHKLF